VKNYYDILQVSQKASGEVIDASWKALIRQCHPDLKKDGEERTRELNEAHDVLSDKKKRRDYDASLQFERVRKVQPPTGGVNPGAYPPPYPGLPHIVLEPTEIVQNFVLAGCQAVIAKVVKENPIIGAILEHGRKKGKKTA
jgi:curved DNA-binding protein CbpA